MWWSGAGRHKIRDKEGFNKPQLYDKQKVVEVEDGEDGEDDRAKYKG